MRIKLVLGPGISSVQCALCKQLKSHKLASCCHNQFLIELANSLRGRDWILARIWRNLRHLFPGRITKNWGRFIKIFWTEQTEKILQSQTLFRVSYEYKWNENNFSRTLSGTRHSGTSPSDGLMDDATGCACVCVFCTVPSINFTIFAQKRTMLFLFQDQSPWPTMVFGPDEQFFTAPLLFFCSGDKSHFPGVATFKGFREID